MFQFDCLFLYSKLEIYPIRNWYVLLRQLMLIIPLLEIYPIRNWYPDISLGGLVEFQIRNISYKELILEWIIYIIFIYLIRNISYKELIRTSADHGDIERPSLEIYPIRNWYRSPAVSSSISLAIRNISYKELIQWNNRSIGKYHKWLEIYPIRNWYIGSFPGTLPVLRN